MFPLILQAVGYSACVCIGIFGLFRVAVNLFNR